MQNRIALSVPNISGKEAEYAIEALNSGWVSTGGEFITRFEQCIANYVGVDRAVACQSGTAGLHLALLVNGIGAGDAVIVPTLTFIATVNPVKYVGAEPIFMDCDDTLCMDMDKLEEFLEQECRLEGNKLKDKAGRHIKAVMVVHVFGNMADMEKLIELSHRFGFTVIEDATEALGTYAKQGRYEGKHSGTIGDIGVYSFNGNKIITTGGGGMIVSNNKDILKKAAYLSTQAKDDEVYYIHGDVGYNYRMTNLQAALGLAQMEQLEKFIQIKQENYAMYNQLGIELVPFRKDIRPNYWFYSHISRDRDGLIKYMSENGVQTRPIWYLGHQQKHFQSCLAFKIEKAVQYWEKVVNIPCSTGLSKEDVNYVSGLIKSYKV